MNRQCYTRPNKPMITAKPVINITTPDLTSTSLPRLVEVDRATQCHVTPPPVAARMVEYLDYQPATIDTAGQTVIEPQAGTGNLINALLQAGVLSGYILGIEKHCKLVNEITNRFSDDHRLLKIHQGDCLTADFDFCMGEYDRAISNPPFENVAAHVQRVYDFLKPGGVAVCLVPVTYKKLDHEVLENLPGDTFASCTVYTKIIRLTKPE